MMVSAEQLAQVGFQYIGIPYDRLDCQAFVELCLKTCGNNTNLSGSNAWYRQMTWKGSPEDCKKEFGRIPDGAFLFILEHDGKEPEKYRHDGIGNAKHIGIVTGTGKGAIHSSESRGGVCESEFHGKTIKNGGWNRIGLWDQVDYGEAINRALGGGGSGGGGTEVDKATVRAEKGSTVRMRQSPSESCRLSWDIPVGTIVELLDWGEKWSQIRTGGRTGYMMSKFLVRGEVVPGDQTDDDKEIRVDRAALADIYNRIGEMLGYRG